MEVTEQDRVRWRWIKDNATPCNIENGKVTWQFTTGDTKASWHDGNPRDVACEIDAVAKAEAKVLPVAKPAPLKSLLDAAREIVAEQREHMPEDDSYMLTRTLDWAEALRDELAIYKDEAERLSGLVEFAFWEGTDEATLVGGETQEKRDEIWNASESNRKLNTELP